MEGCNEEKGRGMGNCNGKGNGMEGKGEAYRFILGGRGGKINEGMGRGTGNTGDGEGEARGEEEAREERKVKRAGQEKRK